MGGPRGGGGRMAFQGLVDRAGCSPGVSADLRRRLLSASASVQDWLAVKNEPDGLRFGIPKIVICARKDDESRDG